MQKNPETIVEALTEIKEWLDLADVAFETIVRDLIKTEDDPVTIAYYEAVIESSINRQTVQKSVMNMVKWFKENPGIADAMVQAGVLENLD